jgi:lysophospholipase L1-like esterase
MISRKRLLSGVIPAVVALTIASPLLAQRRGGRAGQPAQTQGQAQAPAQKVSLKFDFGPGKVQDGYTQVLPDTNFTPERGYGFDLNTKPSAGVDQGGDALTGDFVTGEQPFYFSAVVPEGTYKVTVTLGDPKGASTTTVKAEQHRLMLEGVHTDSGKVETKSFMVNTRSTKISPPIPTNAPGRPEVTLGIIEARTNGGLTWDDKLTLEFLDAKPCVSSVTIETAENVPTVFVIGDSTVTDQPGNTTTSWGQMLTRFLGPDVAVANYAESGETMKSSISELRFDKLLSCMKQGDYLLVQFGHNDSKSSWPQTYVAADSTYRDYLKVFIGEARRRGATPVIISPMERRNNGTTNSHGGYPDAVAAVAKETGCAFIDLHSLSQKFQQALGENVAVAFNDGTHHSRYGAYELAKMIAQGIKDNKLDLANHLAPDFTGFDPSKPDKFEDFKVPQSAGGNTRPPTVLPGS